MSENNGDIRQIERRCRDIENGRRRLRGANSDAVETDAEEYHEPDCVNRCMRVLVDFRPDTVRGVRTFSKDASVLGMSHCEKGKASSLANAYAILVSASIAEQPVKN